MQRVVLLILLLSLLTTFPLTAQSDDCDPNIFSGNSWLESKRSFFGPNCMQFALNRANSSDFQYYITLSDGNQVPTLDLFKRIDCDATGGCWKSMIRNTYESMSTFHEKGVRQVFSRPVTVQNFGSSVVVSTFTMPFDTTWVEYNDAALLSKILDEQDEYDEYTISIDRHREEGLLYYKLTARFDLTKHPLEPSGLAQRIVYFANGILLGMITEMGSMEINEMGRIRENEQKYFQRGALAALLNMINFAEKQPAAKEGSWSFTRENQTQWFRIENDGDAMRMLVWMNADAKKKEAVASKMAEWAKKKPFKNGTSTVFEKRGNDYWLVTSVPLAGKEGSEVIEDYYQEFFDEYCADFYEEVKDIADDID